MQLLSSQMSPYAARVRLAIYAKSLPVSIVPSGLWTTDGAKSPQYLAVNPIGKVPTLVLPDGRAIPESDTIVEFLADTFPAAKLRPDGAEDIARGRLLARITDLYIVTPGAELLPQVLSASRNHSEIARGIEAMREGLGYLEHYLHNDAYAVGLTLTTADCALAPHLFFFPGLVARTLGHGDLLAGHQRVSAYLERISGDAAVAKLWQELRTAIATSRLSALVK
jgi:glutathione S-transferase